MNTPTDAPWSAEQVTALAPDAQVSKAGLKLAAPGTWSRPGTDGTLLWGAARGSGKNPYKVCVDLTGPAFTPTILLCVRARRTTVSEAILTPTREGTL